MTPKGKSDFYDIHCHIIHGVDDGSDSLETSLAMLKKAEEEGITHIIATPHFKANKKNASVETIDEKIKEIREEAKKQGINVELYHGNEVMFFSDFEEVFHEHKFTSLNNSGYLLTEFYPDDDFTRIRQGVETIGGMGLIPVVAHVERYIALRKDISKVEMLADYGALLSVNVASVMGENGFKVKWFVRKLLKRKLVSFVCTDAHDTSKYPIDYKKCADYLYSKYDEKYVDGIVRLNAAGLIESE